MMFEGPLQEMMKQAQKDNDEDQEFIYENKLVEANRTADELKRRIQASFNSLFN